jgi:flagellar motor switch/type III secretory pathway protein FliN
MSVVSQAGAGLAAKPATAGGAAAAAAKTAAAVSKADEKATQEDARWRPVMGLPCELVVDLPLPNFKIADFLKLRVGMVVNAQWRLGHDLPLRLHGTLLGWTKIEVVGNRLAVRLTELA